jgi:hypothetical protein
VKVSRGPPADAPSGRVIMPPMLRVGNTETSRSPGGEMGGLNGHDIEQAFRDKGYLVTKAMTMYGRGGCDNHGFVVFDKTETGLREAATLAMIWGGQGTAWMTFAVYFSSPPWRATGPRSSLRGWRQSRYVENLTLRCLVDCGLCVVGGAFWVDLRWLDAAEVRPL